MSSVQTLRDFISARLTAAAGEIFTVFQQTIVQYEEEIDRQRKLLQIRWKPQIKLHRTESLRQHVGQQKTSSCLEQEEHEAPHIKEEEDLVEVTVTDGESDDSHDSVRDLTAQRLTAAAVEIFTLFEPTISRYEEEIDRQRRLLEIVWKPQIKLHRTDVSEEKQLIHQETNSSLEHQRPQPPRVQEEREESERWRVTGEQEGTCTGLEGEQCVVKLETQTLLVTFKEEPRYLTEPNPERPQVEEKPEESVRPRNREDHGNPEGQESRCTIQEWEQLDPESFVLASTEEQSHFSEADSGQFLCRELREDRPDDSAKSAEAKADVTDNRDDVDNFQKRSETEQQVAAVDDTPRTVSKHSGQGLRTHTGEKPYTCETCGKGFSHRCHFLRHARIHTGEKPYSCKTCGESFNVQSTLVVHMRTHTGEKPYSCGTCGKRFSVHSSVVRHMRTHTGEKPYSCETCGKSYSVHSSLLVHMRTHTGEKPYSCEICGKCFIRQNILMYHMTTHIGEKPYFCATCGKRFGTHSSLLRHMRNHTGEKPYSCETCGESFNVHRTLLVHMRTHTGEKPYPCETCGKSFSVHSNLTRHMRTHTGEKPHSCQTCGKSYSSHRTLLVHMRTHTGEKLYS